MSSEHPDSVTTCARMGTLLVNPSAVNRGLWLCEGRACPLFTHTGVSLILADHVSSPLSFPIGAFGFGDLT